MKRLHQLASDEITGIPSRKPPPLVKKSSDFEIWGFSGFWGFSRPGLPIWRGFGLWEGVFGVLGEHFGGSNYPLSPCKILSYRVRILFFSACGGLFSLVKQIFQDAQMPKFSACGGPQSYLCKGKMARRRRKKITF